MTGVGISRNPLQGPSLRRTIVMMHRPDSSPFNLGGLISGYAMPAGVLVQSQAPLRAAVFQGAGCC